MAAVAAADAFVASVAIQERLLMLEAEKTDYSLQRMS